MSNINKHYAEILREDFTTVGVKFNNTSTVFTYKVDNETARKVKLGCTVIVPRMDKKAQAVYHDVETMEEMALEMEVRVPISSGIVVEIHETPQIDLESEIQYKWVVDVMDFTRYHENNSKDETIRQLANKSRAMSARQQLRASLMTPELQLLLGNG